MGLKYNFYLIKTDVDIKKKLVEIGYEDTTSLMNKSRSWEKKHHKKVFALKDMPISIEEKKKLWDEYMEEKPPGELDAYLKDQYSDEIDYFHIYWMDFRDHLLVGHTDFRMGSGELFALFIGFLRKVGVDEVCKMGYHHGSNDGYIHIYKWIGEEFNSEDIKSNEDECENFDKYLNRVSKIIPYPVKELHRKMKRINKMPWEHEIRLSLKV